MIEDKDDLRKTIYINKDDLSKIYYIKNMWSKVYGTEISTSKLIHYMMNHGVTLDKYIYNLTAKGRKIDEDKDKDKRK